METFDLLGDEHLTSASIAWIRQAEKATGHLLTDGTLMQRAAAGVAEVVADEAHHRRAERIVVLVGPGNNGGDALYAARLLSRDYRMRATVVLAAQKAHAEGLAAVRREGLTVIQHPGDEAVDDCAGEHCGGSDAMKAVGRADLVVDGVLGIGAEPREGAPWASLVRAIPYRARVIAVDCLTPGVRADRTVTFGHLKTPQLLDSAAGGEVTLVDIGLEGMGHEGMGHDGVDAIRLGVGQLAGAWPQPGPRDHKYTRGVVGMATGSDAFVGAAVLGCVAAVTAGPGMVRYVGPQRAADAVSAAVPEATHGVGRVQAWVVGSGIDGITERERDGERYRSAMNAISDDAAVVLDAGALSWLDDIERPEGSVTVMTPHAGELASAFALLDITDDGDEITREAIEADPVRWARRAAQETGYVVLLKGGTTVVASPDRQAVLVENRAPNWLATAGTGDVLAGLLGVVLAAGVEPQTACALAAYVHGRAAHLANPGGPVRALDVASHLGRAVTELLDMRRAFLADLRAGRLD